MRLLGLLFLGLMGFPSIAQEVGSVQTQVTFIAGQTIYVSSGVDVGLAAGDTVTVLRDGERLGRMHVISATPDRAVLGFVGTAFPVTMGDDLTMHFAEVEAQIVTDPVEPVVVDRPSILLPVLEDDSEPAYSGPKVTGRFQLGVSTLMSSTSASTGAASVDRTYATPFALLRAEVADLPGGLALSTGLRTAYRYADPTPFSEEVDIRVYDLSVTKSFASIPLEIQAGRFYNPYDRFSGYWDGLNVHVGGRELGFGVAAGFQPDRGNEVPTSDLPKVTAFGHAAFESESVRFDGTLLAGQIRPQSTAVGNRTFVGFQQQVFAGNLRASAEALVDQDPETDEWVFSRLGGRVSLTAAPGLRVHGFATSRRSYILYGDLQTLLPRTTRLGVGATVTVRNGPLPGVSLRGDITSARTEGQPTTMTVSGGVSIPRLPSTSFGFSADATVWHNQILGETRRGIYGGAGLTKSFGSAYGRVGYRYQQSPLLGLDDLVSHGLDAMLQVPLRAGVALTVQASTSVSELASSTRLYSAIWYRF